MAGLIYDVGVVRSISFWKCHRAPTVWLPELTQGCRYSLALGRKPPLIPALAVLFWILDHREVMLNAHPVREPPQGKAGADKVMELPGAVKGR